MGLLGWGASLAPLVLAAPGAPTTGSESLVGARASGTSGEPAQEPPHGEPASGPRGAPSVSAAALPAAQASAPDPSRETLAEPTNPQACLPLHERAQELTLDGQLRAAKAALRLCSIDICPAMVRADCRSWLVETERSIPTIVFELRAQVEDLSAARLYINDQPTPLVLDEPVAFDPGSIRLRFEAEGQSATQLIILRQGEKNRVIPLDFPEPPPPSAAAATASGAASQAAASQAAAPQAAASQAAAPQAAAPVAATQPAAVGNQERHSRRLATYVLGGVAVAASASATYFGIRGLQDAQGARDRCAPLCDKSESAQIRKQLVLADVSGGVALLSATLAVALYAIGGGDSNVAASGLDRWGLERSADGARATYRGAF
jgi:hypothetical protein